MKKRLVIFDLDGTLLNTIADLAVATNEALKAMGYPTHSEEVIQTFVGNGVSKLLERSMPEDKRTEENISLVRRHFMAYYDQHNADLSTPYPGIADMLSRIQEAGVMLAVASNKYQSATEKLIAHYFPHINFVCVLGQRQGIPVKPSPDIVHEIMEKANVGKSDTLYVGDSGVDMQTAINAGIDSVAVSWGFRPRAELEAFRTLAIIDKAEDLKNWIL
ncbi:MAG: HAD family hydrolase [Bacteroidaceae bacterium]|nr:HAD family hydrolase [Bacteroidaceae bacterium]